jgi:hypothetical protein
MATYTYNIFTGEFELDGSSSAEWGQITGNVSDQPEYGAANGIASLDGTGKLPISQLPTSVMEYKGVWDANTNTPTLIDGTGDTGDTYRVSVDGTQDLGSGSIDFVAGDLVIYDGSVWQRSPEGAADTTHIYSTNLYVATNGDDGTAIVGNQNLPYATIEAAIAAASSGDTIHINTGTYNIVSPLNVGTKSLTFKTIGGQVIIPNQTGNRIASTLSTANQVLGFDGDFKITGETTVDWLFEINNNTASIIFKNCWIEVDGTIIVVALTSDTIIFEDCFLLPTNGGLPVSATSTNATKFIRCDIDGSLLGLLMASAASDVYYESCNIIYTDGAVFTSGTGNFETYIFKNCNMVAASDGRFMDINANRSVYFIDSYLEGGRSGSDAIIRMRNQGSGASTLSFENCDCYNTQTGGSQNDPIVYRLGGSSNIIFKGYNNFLVTNPQTESIRQDSGTGNYYVYGSMVSNGDMEGAGTHQILTDQPIYSDVPNVLVAPKNLDL